MSPACGQSSSPFIDTPIPMTASADATRPAYRNPIYPPGPSALRGRPEPSGDRHRDEPIPPGTATALPGAPLRQRRRQLHRPGKVRRPVCRRKSRRRAAPPRHLRHHPCSCALSLSIPSPVPPEPAPRSGSTAARSRAGAAVPGGRAVRPPPISPPTSPRTARSRFPGCGSSH